ncbi:MAG: hypothetical protein AAFN81_21865 [Bacteroidota bacterium]
MRNLGYLLLFILLGILLHLIFDWYAIAIAGVLFGILAPISSAWRAVGFGFLGGLLIWGGYSTYLSWQNEGLLAMRFGITLGNIGPWGVLALTAFLGSVYAALGSLTGYLGRRAFSPVQ